MTAADLVLAVVMLSRFVPGTQMQFVEKFSWVPQVGIQYYMAVDGISMPLLALSALLCFLAVIASWKIEKKPSFYFAMLLLLQVGMNGVFAALDFVLFYVFWELVLVPMYFLIAEWGGPRREYAAVKFFLYTLLGSVFMLVGIVALYLQTGSFDLIELSMIGPGFAARRAVVALLGVLPRLRCQGARVPAAHVAARRPRRGAHGGVGAARRHHAQDGHLRLLAGVAADPAGCGSRTGRSSSRYSRWSRSSTVRRRRSRRPT